MQFLNQHTSKYQKRSKHFVCTRLPGMPPVPPDYNNITCIDMIAALENSSIIYTPTCKVLFMTVFNFFCINLCYRALRNVPVIALCTLRRSLGPHIVSP